MKVNLGGDRIGSGSKMEVSMRNYNRSTHNLSQRFTSSAAAGVLYPFLKLVSMRADAFDIDLDAACLTLPTQGPLFGSFKMQLDLYQCPWRLYQALLHNNPTAIGLKANQIVLPQIRLQTYQGIETIDKKTAGKIKENTLLKYLGMSGIGQINRTAIEQRTLQRNIQCIPLLAYYDIFKNYYSNKQEENAYVIGRKENEEYYGKFYSIQILTKDNELLFTGKSVGGTTNFVYEPDVLQQSIKTFIIDLHTDTVPQNIYLSYSYRYGEESTMDNDDYLNVFNNSIVTYEKTNTGYKIYIYLENDMLINDIANFKGLTDLSIEISENTILERRGEISILPFKLKNIDDMRMEILSKHTLGNPFIMRLKGPSSSLYGDWNEESGTDGTGLPYSANFNYHLDNNEHIILDAHDTDMCGLMLKTYQADLFNNWINTDWIDGENGINEITKVAVSDGAFTIDALNLAEKLYNLLNRVAVCGNTYENWQDAVYTQSPRRHIESPVFIGGASYEVVFEQIVQNTPAEVGGETTTLGTLGGKGKLIKRKGGRVHVKIVKRL